MNPDDVYAKILSKLMEAGSWPTAFVAALAGAWFWFKGRNIHPEWATRGDLTDLEDVVGRLDSKVDRIDESVHDTREILARIEGLLEGRKR